MNRVVKKLDFIYDMSNTKFEQGNIFLLRVGRFDLLWDKLRPT